MDKCPSPSNLVRSYFLPLSLPSISFPSMPFLKLSYSNYNGISADAVFTFKIYLKNIPTIVLSFCLILCLMCFSSTIRSFER